MLVHPISRVSLRRLRVCGVYAEAYAFPFLNIERTSRPPPRCLQASEFSSEIRHAGSYDAIRMRFVKRCRRSSHICEEIVGFVSRSSIVGKGLNYFMTLNDFNEKVPRQKRGHRMLG